MIDGSMKEATERVAYQPDCEPEVFKAACQFAYTAEYTNPYNVVEKPPPP